MRNDTSGTITAAVACPCCNAQPGQVCRNIRSRVPFTGLQVHTERVTAAGCSCMRFQPGGVGPWQIIPNPSCDVHGDDE